MKPVQLALVGCGRIAQIHLRALQRVPEVEVRALADADPGRGAHYASLAEVLEDRRIDAVAICLPPLLHAAAAIEVLRARKHLYLEKPATVSRAENEAVERAAAGCVRVVQTGFHLRHHPDILAAWRRVRAGRLGLLHSLRGVFTNGSALHAQEAWQQDPDGGGGVLLALGVHHFDLWRHLTGADVVEVQAQGDDRRTVGVQARLSDGTLASTVLSHVTVAQNELELHGGLGRLRVADYRFDSQEMQSLDAVPGSLPERAGGWVRGALALSARLWLGSALERAYQNAWRQFARRIAGGESPAADLADGLRATEVALAATESLRTGQAVRVQAMGQ